MGINYYLKTKSCANCGFSKKSRHIGRLSGGWQFHFRGYRKDSIHSVKDWWNELVDPEKEIVDDEERKLTLNEFCSLVESNRKGLNHYNIVARTPQNEEEKKYLKEILGKYSTYPDADSMSQMWKDDQGHCFTDNEFS